MSGSAKDDKEYYRYRASGAGKGAATRRVQDSEKFNENWDNIFKCKPKRNALRCLDCGDEIESAHRHDFVKCTCGNCAVDGGTDYFRRVFEPGASWENLD